MTQRETVTTTDNETLLRRLDEWDGSTDAGPLIRWAAAHLRGCIEEKRRRYIEAVVQRAELDASRFGGGA